MSVRSTPVVICSRQAANTAKLFFYKMNNDGATPRIERTDAVPVVVVEEVLDTAQFSTGNLPIFAKQQ